MITKYQYRLMVVLGLVMLMVLAACSPAAPNSASRKSIVVSHSVLGALVKDLAGDGARVTVLIPNGQDPHDWEPSAKDIEAVNKADLLVLNGLGLEAHIHDAIEQARARGVKVFTGSDYIKVRQMGEGVHHEDDPDARKEHDHAAGDPHYWMDPLSMKAVVVALAPQVKAAAGLDVAARGQDLAGRLDALNTELAGQLNRIPADGRKLVTGHESLGYFAQRYGYEMIGAVVPSITTQAEASAADLAALKNLMQAEKVKALFTELGTPRAVADAIARETGAKAVPLATHQVPADGSYFTYMRNLVKTITGALG